MQEPHKIGRNCRHLSWLFYVSYAGFEFKECLDKIKPEKVGLDFSLFMELNFPIGRIPKIFKNFDIFLKKYTKN